LDTVRQILHQFTAQGTASALEPEYFIHTRSYRSFFETARDRIQQAGDAMQVPSLRRDELRRGLDCPDPLWNRLLEDLEAAELIRSRGHKVVLPEAAGKMDQTEGPLLKRLLDTYLETGFKSPRPDELPAMLGESAEKINRLLECLYNEEKLILVSKNVVLGAQSLRQAQSRVVAILQERGTLNSADFKYEIDSSRKYALAILDWLDARHVTLRIGNDRKLTPDFQKHLL
jgi:selenocysteine-specific elongation factor